MTLIAFVEPEEETNKNGFETAPEEEIKTEVFAKKMSVTQSEFYKGETSGHNPRFRFQILIEEFDDQTMAEYKGKRYHILRDYSKDGSDFVEIILSELPRGGGRLDG